MCLRIGYYFKCVFIFDSIHILCDLWQLHWSYNKHWWFIAKQCLSYEADSLRLHRLSLSFIFYSLFFFCTPAPQFFFQGDKGIEVCCWNVCAEKIFAAQENKAICSFSAGTQCKHFDLVPPLDLKSKNRIFSWCMQSFLVNMFLSVPIITVWFSLVGCPRH